MTDIPQIVRESAAAKAKGKEWMQKHMNADHAFVKDGQLDDQPLPAIVIQDVMGVVKGIRRENPGRNVLLTAEESAALPMSLPVATATNTLLQPVLERFQHYAARARGHRHYTHVLCFDYYDMPNPAKLVCQALRDEKDEEEEPVVVPVQDSYITDWAQPLPDNWNDLMHSRNNALPVVLRDLCKEIVQRCEVHGGQRLIICGHSLDLASVDHLAEYTSHHHWAVPAAGVDFRRWPLVITRDTAHFDSTMRVEQPEGDLQMFTLLNMLGRAGDHVHLLSKDTDVMYYALWYAASQGHTRVAQLLWKHQWSRHGDSWLNVYDLCGTIARHPTLGEHFNHEAVKNLVVCMVATGTDYTSGYQGIGHMKWLKPWLTSALRPLFGGSTVASKKRKVDHDGLDHEAYYALACQVLGGTKMGGNAEVVCAVGQQLDYFVRCFLQSVGEGAPSGNVKLSDFPFHPSGKRRLYTTVSKKKREVE